jgi:hypothetical protein
MKVVPAFCACSVAGVASFVASQAKPSAAADVSAAWSSFCNGTLKRNSSLCAKVADSIRASNAGNIGRRAGAICLTLGGERVTALVLHQQCDTA